MKCHSPLLSVFEERLKLLHPATQSIRIQFLYIANHLSNYFWKFKQITVMGVFSSSEFHQSSRISSKLYINIVYTGLIYQGSLRFFTSAASDFLSQRPGGNLCFQIFNFTFQSEHPIICSCVCSNVVFINVSAKNRLLFKYCIELFICKQFRKEVRRYTYCICTAVPSHTCLLLPYVCVYDTPCTYVSLLHIFLRFSKNKLY